jgi:hypothetical protein
VECVKDLGCCTRDHSKVVVNNLFNNFCKSHVMSTVHIRSWCCRKGVDFCDHPQPIAGKRKSVVMTLDDHRRAVKDGLDKMYRINESTISKNKPFLALGDLDLVELKCFWYKVKCITMFLLCVPRKRI